jgi:hypothetical protein
MELDPHQEMLKHGSTVILSRAKGVFVGFSRHFRYVSGGGYAVTDVRAVVAGNMCVRIFTSVNEPDMWTNLQ